MATKKTGTGRVSKELLFAEVQDLFRTMPEFRVIRNSEQPAQQVQENNAWFGRTAALVNLWNPEHLRSFTNLHHAIQSSDLGHAWHSWDKLQILLQQMRTELLLETEGPRSVVIEQGAPFQYFDHLRKIIEAARADVFFVDPYIDGDVVANYLPSVAAGVPVRLLTSKLLGKLMPAVRLFSQQTNATIEVRVPAAKIHDRWLIIDSAVCYQSGASFKEGGRNSPTTLTQIVDAFPEIQQKYEQLWTAGTVQT